MARPRPLRDAPARRSKERSGRWAETVAAWWLRLHGYRILARRYQSPVGEIDLVARRAGTVAFVEVKIRSRRDDALAALSPGQQARIARAAGAWLQRHREADGMTVRFDLLALAPWRLPVHLTDVWREGTSGPLPRRRR